MSKGLTDAEREYQRTDVLRFQHTLDVLNEEDIMAELLAWVECVGWLASGVVIVLLLAVVISPQFGSYFFGHSSASDEDDE